MARLTFKSGNISGNIVLGYAYTNQRKRATVNTETATRKPTATDRRLAAMRALSDAVVSTARNADQSLSQVWHVTDRAELAAMIRELAPLGRTERWQARVEQWALLVLDENNDFSWAFFQGGIWTGYDA